MPVTVVVLEGAVKVPEERLKTPLISIVELPPVNVPPAWVKPEDPIVTVTPVFWVIMPE